MLALSLFYAGEHEASLKRMKKAIRLTSYPPNWFLAFCGDAYRSCSDLETARAIFEQCLDPDDVARTVLFALQQPQHVEIAQLVVLPVS